MKAPDWTNWLRVDVIIECLPVSNETRRALVDAMPNAYSQPEGSTDPEDPRFREYPWEPDAPEQAPFKLAAIWERLDLTVRADILAAYIKEYGDPEAAL